MNKVNKIAVVGGGSSGWSAALFIKTRIPSMHVSIVVPPDDRILGVGESTNPITKKFNHLTEINDQIFLKETDGTYKIAIEFRNFNKLGGIFLHPFGEPHDTNPVHLYKNDYEKLYASYYQYQKNIWKPTLSYAYHIDALKYATILERMSVKLGVEKITGKIKNCFLSESGEIQSLTLQSDALLTADLYIDCSGFRSILINQNLKIPFLSIESKLPNNKAIAARIPYTDESIERKLSTVCDAQPWGWIWTIPLKNRIGTGYVYSDKYCSENQIYDDFIKYWGESRLSQSDIFHYHMRVGRHKIGWSQNCVAIGPAFGFIEPLESTGISLTQLTIFRLTSILEKQYYTPEEVVIFNQQEASVFDNTVDFIQAHYIYSRRNDSVYWQDIKTLYNQTDLEYFIYKLKTEGIELFKTFSYLYGLYNWNVILSGMEAFQQPIEQLIIDNCIKNMKNHDLI